jgi:protein involved in polysaccharide export with SLBB domain
MNQFLQRALLIFFLVFSGLLSAQNKGDINLQNLSTVNVDQLSDAQIADFWQQAQDKGLSMVQLQQLATQRNMKPNEMAKLKIRIENLPANANQTKKLEDEKLERTYTDNDENNPTPNAKVISNIFGADLFSNKNLTFEPNLKMATPLNYQLGPDDELLIDISGYSEASYKLRVSLDGNIRIPVVGQVSVGGLTIEQASKKIIRQLSLSYAGISNGETTVSIALGNIRSIKVTILGEVNLPGSYTLPSLATTFNALYASGGPNNNGSFRNITLIRNGKLIANIDIYEFLLKGNAKGNVRLQDQDVIKVNSYDTRVELKGEVKREGRYEVLKTETLKDVIEFAGGYTENAYKDRIKVYRNTAKEKSVADVPQDLIPMFTVQTGDIYTIDKVLERFSNRVQINGSVFRPGYFALDEGLTLTKLIKKADGVKEDAFTNRGLIYRLKDDNSLEVISFDVTEVLAGKDIVLKREDNIQILSKLELREEYTVSIAGEVIKPGKYPYAENLKVEDLIITAGGLKESASITKIEIARRIKNIDVSNADALVSSVITYEVGADLKTKEGKEFLLLPFDVVSVYKLPGFQNQRNITLEGEVYQPGQYTLSRNNEKISDVIKRAGGLTSSSYADGAVLLRTTQLSSVDKFIKKKKIASLEKQTSDTNRVNELSSIDLVENLSIVGINLAKILKHPGSKYDLVLEENDIIRIPRYLQTVKVSGEVLYPLSIQYEKGKKFNKYVNGSGGYTERGLRKRGYIVYANGSSASTHKVFLFFNKHPKVKPGAEIIIPSKEERNKLSAVEIASITTSFVTLLLLVYTLTNN